MNNFDDLFEPQAEQTQDQPFDKEAWVERKQAERQDVYDLVDILKALDALVPAGLALGVVEMGGDALVEYLVHQRGLAGA